MNVIFMSIFTLNNKHVHIHVHITDCAHTYIHASKRTDGWNQQRMDQRMAGRPAGRTEGRTDGTNDRFIETILFLQRLCKPEHEGHWGKNVTLFLRQFVFSNGDRNKTNCYLVDPLSISPAICHLKRVWERKDTGYGK